MKIHEGHKLMYWSSRGVLQSEWTNGAIRRPTTIRHDLHSDTKQR